MISRKNINGVVEMVGIIILLLCPTVYYIKLNQYPINQPEILWLLVSMGILGALLGALIHYLSWSLRTIVITALVMSCLSFFPEFHSKWPMTLGFLVSLILVMLLHRFIGVILLVMGVALLGTTMTFSVGSIQTDPTLQAFSVGHERQELKPVIHILLDEHIGIDGIPMEIDGASAIKKSLKNFYTSHGFHLYAKAYSHYSRSYNAVPNILNFFPRSLDNIYFQGSKMYNVLSENAYFHRLSDMGYHLRIYQSSYIDFCHLSDVNFKSCYTYPATSIKYLAALSIPTEQKLLYIGRSFLLTSYLYEILLKGYEDQLRQLASHFNYSLGHWPWYHSHTSTLGSRQVFPALIADLKKGSGGTAFFAHLILPHSPYIFDENCQVNPKVSEWELHTYIGDEINTVESRKQRYQRYLPQVGCVQKTMAQFFQQLKNMGIYQDAMIVVHSDHGSRIMVNGPFKDNQNRLTKQDFNDGFSTLFAIKAPGYEPGLSQKQLAADYLLARFVERITGEGLPLKERESYVFLSPKEAKSQHLMTEMPLDKFIQ